MKYLNTGNLTEGTYNRNLTERTSLKEPAIRLLPLREPAIGLLPLREPTGVTYNYSLHVTYPSLFFIL